MNFGKIQRQYIHSRKRHFYHSVRCVWLSTTGATAVEYGLLAGLVALGIAGGLGVLADLVNMIFELIGTSVGGVADNIATE